MQGAIKGLKARQSLLSLSEEYQLIKKAMLTLQEQIDQKQNEIRLANLKNIIEKLPEKIKQQFFPIKNKEKNKWKER